MDKWRYTSIYDPLEEMSEYAKLKSINDRLRGLLREFEWYDYDDKHGDWFCVICDANKKDGHADDCRLAKELSNATLGG